MPDFITYAAKAVAALVTPWVVLAVGWLALQGIDIPIDESVAQAIVTSAASAVIVFLVRNRVTAQQRMHTIDAERDRGISAVELLAIVVLAALVVFGLFYILGR